jgi:hypothetical protein
MLNVYAGYITEPGGQFFRYGLFHLSIVSTGFSSEIRKHDSLENIGMQTTMSLS